MQNNTSVGQDWHTCEAMHKPSAPQNDSPIECEGNTRILVKLRRAAPWPGSRGGGEGRG